MFFGEKLAFNEIAGVTAQHQKTGLIHTISDNVANALAEALDLASHLTYRLRLPRLTCPPMTEDMDFNARNHHEASVATIECLRHISDRGIELFSGYDDRLRAFILEFKSEQVAVLINPPDQTNNMFCYRTLELYEHAIKMFAALRLPLVVMLDTPGIDPRFDGQNQGTIEKLISVTGEILNYPMPTMGIINGRGYGGANSLGIPKCYGSVSNYGIEGRMQIDVMHESIMRALLSGSKDLLEDWENMRTKQDEDCKDLVANGLLDDIIRYQDLPAKIWQDLFTS